MRETTMHNGFKYHIGASIEVKPGEYKIMIGIDDVGQPIIKCKYCSHHTTMLGTGLCYGCWEGTNGIIDLSPIQLANLISKEKPTEYLYKLIKELEIEYIDHG